MTRRAPSARPPLVLLPPSEGKTGPRRGRPVDLGALSFPELTPVRAAVLGDLAVEPAVAAGRLYTGVLYAALDLPSLPAAVARDVVIVSAQFGALRPRDRVPAYRREMDAALWRDALRAPLDAAARGRVVLDCRSATYAAAWRPSGGEAGWLHVAVAEERAGVRRVVSHMAKRTRGEVARHVLTARARVRTTEEAAAVVAEAFRCELDPPERPGRPWRLTVVVGDDPAPETRKAPFPGPSHAPERT